jgi:agmatine deiminase
MKSSALEGFRLPADWELQEAVWFAWPIQKELWPDDLGKVQDQLIDLYRLCAHFQKVNILCPQSAQVELLRRIRKLDTARQIELWDYETDDVWTRDYGPLFLKSAEGSPSLILDFRFNAWGDKFPLYHQDDGASKWIAEKLGVSRQASQTVLEGGAIDSNGAGTLLTTEAVLLNPNRNGSKSKVAVESLLCNELGTTEVLWLCNGLLGDDTDGHIDNLARFYRKDAILYGAVPSPEDKNFDALLENERRIEGFRTDGNTKFERRAIPMPKPVKYRGQFLAASYLNYLVLNGAVLVPTYGQQEREIVVFAVLQECYPGREIIGFDCRLILREGGALHCLSQNQPAVQ